MKTCHTKSNDIEPGNAITVSTPIDLFQHFFCQCSICVVMNMTATENLAVMKEKSITTDVMSVEKAS